MNTIFAFVLLAATKCAPKGNLPNKHSGIDANGVNSMKLERPLIDRSQINQIRCNIDENAEPADG